MMPDFKGNQSVETCVIRQQGHRLRVRFTSNGGEGAEMVGEVTASHAEWHRQLDNGAQVSFTADVGETGKTMRGAWRLRFSDGAESNGKFCAEKRP